MSLRLVITTSPRSLRFDVFTKLNAHPKVFESELPQSLHNATAGTTDNPDQCSSPVSVRRAILAEMNAVLRAHIVNSLLVLDVYSQDGGTTGAISWIPMQLYEPQHGRTFLSVFQESASILVCTR